MRDKDDNIPAIRNPEPVKLVEQPDPDEEELEEMLAAIQAAKNPDTQLITDEIGEEQC